MKQTCMNNSKQYTDEKYNFKISIILQNSYHFEYVGKNRAQNSIQCLHNIYFLSDHIQS